MIDLTANCVGFWKMNDDDNSQTVLDSSGRGHHGSLDVAETGDITISSGNPPNLTRALDLNEDYPEFITVGDHEDFDFGTGSFSIAFWTNLGVLENSYFASKYDVNAPDGPDGWYISLVDVDTNNWRVWFSYWGAGVNSDGIWTTADLANGVWYFIVVVHDAAGGYDYIYVNGVENVKAACSILNVNMNTSLRIGCLGAGTDPLKGAMDAVMLFNKALSPSEVSALYNAGKGSEELIIGAARPLVGGSLSSGRKGLA